MGRREALTKKSAVQYAALIAGNRPNTAARAALEQRTFWLWVQVLLTTCANFAFMSASVMFDPVSAQGGFDANWQKEGLQELLLAQPWNDDVRREAELAEPEANVPK